jgi:hypothetical protein
VGLAKNYPDKSCDRPLGELLYYNWTIPAEKRKALALKEYMSFAEGQINTSAKVMLDNAREWIALLVPEIKPLLDLSEGTKPAQALIQLQQFLAPADTRFLELPAFFNDSAEVGNLVPK